MALSVRGCVAVEVLAVPLTPVDGAAIALAALSTAVAALGYRTARVRGRALVVPLTTPKTPIAIAVVIPARNEATHLRACLGAVLRDAQAPLHVVVVNDSSTDTTGAIAASCAAQDARVHIVTLSGPLPADTFGKPRALAAGVAFLQERGLLAETLICVDADVTVDSAALMALAATRQALGAAALSALPRVRTTSLWTTLWLAPLIATAMLRVDPARVHDASLPDAFLNGQLLVLDPRALAAVGGFAAVATAVLEDSALGALLKRSGYALRLVDARALAEATFPSRPMPLVGSFRKNAQALHSGRAGRVGVASFAATLLPWLALALSLRQHDAGVAVVAGLVAATVGLQLAVRRTAAAPLWPVAILPLAYLGVLWALGGAGLDALRGRGPRWKDRTYTSMGTES